MEQDPRAPDAVVQQDTPGAQLHAAVIEVLRWASRGDVRRLLLGPAGRDLSVNDVTLLRAIAAGSPVRASTLANSQGVDKSTITPQIRRLEHRGFIARRADPADGRAALLSATPRGRRVRQQLDKAGAAVFDDILRDWPDDDRRALAALIQRFARQLVHGSQTRSAIQATKEGAADGPAAARQRASVRGAGHR
jgi:DNA-binding MarR family transcriptional regulator